MDVASFLPGQYAQSVNPNPKCESCLHYDSQQGPTGACMIGLRPWLCGDGDAPEMGYAPLTNIGPTLPVGSTCPQRLGTEGHDGPDVPMKLVTLGDDYVTAVSAIVSEREALMKMSCPLHQQAIKSMGQYHHSYEEQECRCIPVTDVEVAKALVPLLSNAVRQYVSAQELVDFVGDVRTGRISSTCSDDRTAIPTPASYQRAPATSKTSKMAVVKSSEPDFEKAIDNTKHSYIVTGPLRPQPRGFANLRAASRHVDKLDNEYGGARHSYMRNPDFKPGAVEKALDLNRVAFAKVKGAGHVAMTTHGSYHVNANPKGGHDLHYTPRGGDRKLIGHHPTATSAMGSAITHHNQHRSK